VLAVTQLLGDMKLNKKHNTNQSRMSIIDGLLYHIHKDFFDKYFALAKQLAPLNKQLEEINQKSTNRNQTQIDNKPLIDEIDELISQRSVLYDNYIQANPARRSYQESKKRDYRMSIVDVSWYFLQDMPRSIKI